MTNLKRLFRILRYAGRSFSIQAILFIPVLLFFACGGGGAGSGGERWIVTTLAGDGTRGYLDDTGTAAQFNWPNDVTVDSLGNVYVADGWNYRIRKIDPDGVVTTVAGDGTKGYADGTGTGAQFSDPRGIAIDSSGNIYVTDDDSYTSSCRIRKITSAGVVTTLAGGGYGYADGTGTGAQFNQQPSGIAVDSDGNVYVSHELNYIPRIRKIDITGYVTTIAGGYGQGYSDGPGGSAKFYGLFGMAADGDGNIYVADRGNNRIRKITLVSD